jgi:2'-5' RNA ligase
MTTAHSPDQGIFSFIGKEPWRPARPERLFHGLGVDPEMVAPVVPLARHVLRGLRLSGNPIAPARLHITLHHIGDYRRLRGDILYAAQLAAASVACRSFGIVLYALENFEAAPAAGGRQRKWPLVLRAQGDGLFELHGRLGAAMRKVGLKAGDDFKPHMTLAYCLEPKAWPPIEPVRLVVNDFALVHSLRGLTRYDIKGRWPLQGEA